MREIGAAMIESLKDFGAMVAIVFQCVAAAIVYGILHDQITARVCLEYFSVWHPPILPSWLDPQSPTDQALFWGVAATWWMGLFIGVPLSIVARVGSKPPLSAHDLLRPTGGLLITMALCALLSGIVGYWIARSGIAMGHFAPPFAATLRPQERARFVADYFAHNASYLVGGWGGVVLIVYAVIRRWRRS